MPQARGSPVVATNPALAFGQCVHNFFALLVGIFVGKVFLTIKSTDLSFTILAMWS